MKQFKITESTHGIFLYPIPVDKQKTFLIKAESSFEARLLKHLLEPGYLADPLDLPEAFDNIGFHADQRTPIYRLKWNDLQLHFLPHRELDISRAQILENLLSKKISHLAQGQDKRVIEEILFRFEKQKECTECDKLGINSPGLNQWFKTLTEL
jgi:hypothetical protein